MLNKGNFHNRDAVVKNEYPSIQIYDTYSQTLKPFIPLTPGKVAFYVCGVTVYGKCHLGHARAYVSFDAIRRYFIARDYHVTYVQNFTDIDDKIIKKANAQHISTETLVNRMIASYYEDMDQLGILRADHYPRATQFITQMITMISGLIESGYAYVSKKGDVCFSVAAFSEYGRLSKKILDELESGSRVASDEAKKNPFDFVLWKPAKPGEPSWDSPWGKGRPGWHIECSAMALSCIGETVDIHGGGADLIFPHHENEIAQSQCYTQKPYVNYWLHNGFVTLKNEKMSKSTGNVFGVNEILNAYTGSVIRFFLLKVHYRSPLQYSESSLIESKQALKRLTDTFKSVTTQACHPSHEDQFNKIRQRFHTAMSDDFNTAEAIGVLFDLNKLIHKTQSGTAVLRELGDVLGIFFDISTENDALSSEILMLIDQRNQAKKDRKFDEADHIRDQLLSQYGIILEDTRDGTRWKRC